VHWADDARNERWPLVLDGLAAAGYRWIELGPIGYLPEDPDVLLGELSARRLSVTATYVHEPMGVRSERERILALARRGCRLLRQVGARFLVVIDQRVPERIATAGRSVVAARCSDSEFALLMEGIRAVAEVAREEGVIPVLHPHVAGYIEFRDEIDRALGALDPELISLCIDTGHSAYAGIDPADLYRTYGSRVEYIHLKDISRRVHQRVLSEGLDFHTAMLAGVFCPLGEGIVDFRAFAHELEAGGFLGFACVEQDHEPSDKEKASKALVGAERSLAFLREIRLAAEPEDHEVPIQ
jgi:inosose dehydratase